MPAAGDVDIMIAAEMMEAGRAIMRGFVTPDRTVLIASTHRVLAVSEKIGAGRRHRQHRRGAGGRRNRRAPLLAADFDRGRDRIRLGHLGQPVRRAGRVRRTALPARGVRGRDPHRAARVSKARSAPLPPGSRPPFRRRTPRRPCQSPAACQRPGWPRPPAGGMDRPDRSHRQLCPRPCATWRLPGCARSSISRTSPMALSI